MHRNRTSSGAGFVAGREQRQVFAIIGILLTGIVAAVVLPLWIAALSMLLGLSAIAAIARPEPAMEPVVIRRDERR
ncbi:MAG TPA: hypothetical protein VEX37_10230 [Thermomicrobiales bacterium]|nr:hypothetical protein [Thermomicrobiales bacterium]